MAKKIDRIAQMLNCPEKGEELRRAIIESRKDFLLNQQEADDAEETSRIVLDVLQERASGGTQVL